MKYLVYTQAIGKFIELLFTARFIATYIRFINFNQKLPTLAPEIIFLEYLLKNQQRKHVTGDEL